MQRGRGGDRRCRHYNAGDAVDNAAIARLLFEIGDLLEIRGDNPFKIRAYRNAAETVTAEPTAVAALRRCRTSRAAGDWARPGGAHPRDRRHRRHAVPARAARRLSRDHPRLCSGCRASAPRRSSASTTSWASPRSTRWNRPRATGACARSRAWATKKEALILRAIEERRRYAGRHLSADVARVAGAVVGALAPGGARPPTSCRSAASGARPRRVATSTSSRSGRRPRSWRRSRRCRR